MKSLLRKIFIAVLFLGFAFNVKAVNDTTLTIGQVFGWKAGDTLVYDYYESVNFPYPPYGPGTFNQHNHYGFTIDTRNDFPDTIIFHIRWENGIGDSLMLTNLDTLVTKFGYSVLYPHLNLNSCSGLESMPTCDSSWSNYTFDYIDTPIDTFASLWISFPQFESHSSISFTERVGLRHADMSALEYWPNPAPTMGYSGGCGIKLIYYKSDSLTWADPEYYLSITETAANQNSLHLSPNPANETITLSAETETASSEPFNVLAYDITGACVRNIQTSSIRSLTIPVNDFSPGYYVIKVSNGNHHLAAKGFIIAR